MKKKKFLPFLRKEAELLAACKTSDFIEKGFCENLFPELWTRKYPKLEKKKLTEFAFLSLINVCKCVFSLREANNHFFCSLLCSFPWSEVFFGSGKRGSKRLSESFLNSRAGVDTYDSDQLQGLPLRCPQLHHLEFLFPSSTLF